MERRLLLHPLGWRRVSKVTSLVRKRACAAVSTIIYIPSLACGESSLRIQGKRGCGAISTITHERTNVWYLLSTPRRPFPPATTRLPRQAALI